MSKKRMSSLLVGTAVAVLAAVPGTSSAATAGSSAALTNFHGTVSSVSTAEKTFKIKRANGTSLTFSVTASTVFERVGGGLSALRRGKAIEVKAKRVGGRWVARQVEPGGTSGDDHGGHGNDDPPGDDHGSDG
jgi:Domain of unknown function (DUF5666)